MLGTQKDGGCMWFCNGQNGLLRTSGYNCSRWSKRGQKHFQVWIYIQSNLPKKNLLTEDQFEYYPARLSCTSLMMTYGPGDPNCLENMLMEDSPTTEKEILFWEEA